MGLGFVAKLLVGGVIVVVLAAVLLSFIPSVADVTAASC